MSDPPRIWSELLGKRPVSDCPGLLTYCHREAVLALLEKNLPALFLGEAGVILDKSGLEPFLVQLRQQAGSPQELRTMINFTRAVMEKGNALLGWQAYVPAPARILLRPRTHITTDTFPYIHTARRLEELFLADLNRSDQFKATELMGHLLFSAIMFGGLIDQRWIQPWLEAVQSGQIRRNGTLLWLELEREGKDCLNMKATVSRRWFADPLTSALLLKHVGNPREMPPSLRPWSCLKAYFKRQDNSALPKTLAGLLKCAEMRLRFYLAPFLVDYAAGKLTSVSLPSTAWSRVLSGRGIPAVAGDLPEADMLNTPKRPILSKTIEMKLQDRLLRGMEGAILPYPRPAHRGKRESRIALERYLDDNQEFMVPYLQLIGLWAIALLKDREGRPAASPSGEPLAPSSVLRYVQTLGPRLLSGAADFNPMDATGDEIQSIYENMLANIPQPLEQDFAGKRLAYFHEYLCQTWKVEAVEMDDESSSRSKELGVDANLICPRVYAATLGSLLSFEPDSNMCRIRTLILILGFRCGLRRGEALRLRFKDMGWGRGMPCGDHTELLIRRDVKTSSSVRRIPLGRLLEANELAMFSDWLDDYSDLLGDRFDPGCFLFGRVESPEELLPVAEVFDPIENTLREISGDGNLRFQHLRHSFATWLLVRLLSTLDNGIALPDFIGKAWDIPASLQLKKLIGSDGSTKKVLYLVAHLCGHASPSTTLLHYVHLCDLLLANCLSKADSQPVLGRKIIEDIVGLGRSTSYEMRGKSKIWQMSPFLPRLIDLYGEHLGNPDELSSFPIHKVAIKPAEKVSFPRWRTVQSVLDEMAGPGATAQKVSYRNNLTPETVLAWCAANARIAGLKTSHGASRHGFGEKLRLGPPKRSDDREYVERMVKACQRLSEAKMAAVDGAVKYFLANFGVSTFDVRCKDFSALQTFLKGLKLLAIEPEEVRLHLYPGTAEPSSNGISRGQLIAGKLGLDETQVIVRSAKSDGWRRNLRDTFGVQVVYAKRSQVGGCHKNQASYGYRYALTMIAIIRGL